MAITRISSWKSPVANSGDLPDTGNLIGDVRIAVDTHVPYMWDGATWDAISGGGGGSSTEFNAGNSGSAISLDFAANPNILLTLTANCVLTVTAIPSRGTSGVFRIAQDHIGARAFNRDTKMQFPKHVEPVLSPEANRIDIIKYYSDGVTMYCKLDTNYFPSEPAYSDLTCIDFGADNASAHRSILLGDVFNFNYDDPCSFVFWLKWTADGAGGIITKMNSDGRGFEIHGLEGSYDMGWFNFIEGADNTTLLIINDDPATWLLKDTWYHMAFTNTGIGGFSGLAMYVNGLLYPATNGGGSNLGLSVISDTPAYIGYRPFQEGFEWGPNKIDEMSVWNVGLTAAQVLQLFNEGSPDIDPRTLSFASGLVSFYSFQSPDTSSVIHDLAGANNGTGVNLTSGNFSTDIPVPTP